MNNSASQLTHLKSLLQSRFPKAVVQTSHPRIKEAGAVEVTLLPGRLVEVVAPVNCPGGGLILWRLARAITTPFAFIDGSDTLDPASIDAAVRQRLLWLRCHQPREAVRAADLLLRDGNLSTVILDLRQLPVKDLLRLPSSIWHRLRMLAERTDVSVGVFSPVQIIPCAAQRWSLHADVILSDLDTPAEKLWCKVNPQLQRGIARPLVQAPQRASA